MNVEKLTDDQAVQGYDFAVEVKVQESGLEVIPTAATISIKDPDGEEVLAATAMTVNATTGAMTYTVGSAVMATLWENAVMTVLYTVSSVVHKAMFFFDVVLNPLKCNVTDDDLKKYSPQIVDQLWADEQENYSPQIQEAFAVIKRQIKNKGKRPSMIIDGSQVRELVILKTLSMISFDFAKDPDDIWFKRYEKYAAAYESQFAALSIKYDEDESGTIEDDEKETVGQVTLLV